MVDPSPKTGDPATPGDVASASDTDLENVSIDDPNVRRMFLRLVLLGLLVGVPAALIANGFLNLVDTIHDWLWTDLPDDLGADSPPWYLILGLPVVGGFVVWAARALLPGDGGHDPLTGLSIAPTPVRYAPSVALAALGTLPFGLVLGPEAPLIALGSATALAVTAWVRLGDPEKRAIASAGSFSAISALFGGPVVAGVLMMEGGISLGRKLIPVLVPGLVAAGSGYVVFTGIGGWDGLDPSSLHIPGLPKYGPVGWGDIGIGLLIGLLTALVVAAVHVVAHANVAISRDRLRLGLGPMLLIGGAAVGGLALLADALGADSTDVLFSGQDSLDIVSANLSVEVLLVVIAAKALAYAVSLSAGFRGGPVFPSIFLGIAIATIGINVFDISPTLAIAVGGAAGMAACTKLLFTPLVFGILLVGSPGVDTVVPMVLATVLAWLVTMALDRKLAAPDMAENRAAA